MKTILIGAHGYIGRHLVYMIAPLCKEIKCYDRLGGKTPSGQMIEALDITNHEEVSQLNFNVDVVFVFAGLTGTAASFKNASDYTRVNEIGLLNILDSMVKQNSQARIIFPSTRLVYKGIKNKLLNESSEKETKTIYALNKLSCESILALYAQTFDIDYSIFRICVPYGNIFEGEYSYGTTAFFLNNAMQGKDIEIYGEGKQQRTFTHVQDICECIIRTLSLVKANREIFNIGGEKFSIAGVAQKIAERYSVKVISKAWPDFDLKIESGDTIFNSFKLDSLTGYTYQHTFDCWLKEIKKIDKE